MILVTLMNVPHAVVPTVGPPIVILHSVHFMSTDPSAVEDVAAHLKMTRCDHEPWTNDTNSVNQKL